MALLPPLRHHPRSIGINLGTYDIWDGWEFGIPQEIQDVEKGNYELIILTETKIPYAVYCCNILGYDIF